MARRFWTEQERRAASFSSDVSWDVESESKAWGEAQLEKSRSEEKDVTLFNAMAVFPFSSILDPRATASKGQRRPYVLEREENVHILN